jgi:hypothetical protein
MSLSFGAAKWVTVGSGKNLFNLLMAVSKKNWFQSLMLALCLMFPFTGAVILAILRWISPILNKLESWLPQPEDVVVLYLMDIVVFTSPIIDWSAVGVVFKWLTSFQLLKTTVHFVCMCYRISRGVFRK